MNIVSMSPIMMKRFIDGIDSRIYRISGTSISFNLIDDTRTETQYITIGISSSIDNGLICRIHVGDNNTIMIESINPITNLFEEPIYIGSLCDANIANRIFNKVQEYVMNWFKVKEDGQ